MDERPGYFIFDMGLGERNDINYNGRYSAKPEYSGTGFRSMIISTRVLTYKTFQ
ncbi:MAG: hypothetical protein IPL53_10815 [Ignavibacteria bacterium]|nr:hypothetical protein [Ignavibacteria bacterium]